MLKTIHYLKLAQLYVGAISWQSAILLATALGGRPTVGQAQTVSYAAPITITQGGTYTGNYQSLASGVPCVRIATTDPVILSGCTFSGAGNLIEAGEGTNLTVRNCTGLGLTPSVDGQAPGRFLDVYKAKNLVIEHNAFTQTSGIVVNRWSAGQAGQTLTVRYNRVRNIDGRWRNGGSTLSSFLQLNTVTQLAGVEIAYNEVINTPNQSLVEDNINLYNSSGTAQSALRVHDNFVRGAYPYPATAASFSGTGMTTDGDGSTLDVAAGYIEADHNQFVGTGNAAMNLAAGHDVYYHDNRAVTSGILPDGRRFNAGWAGLGIFNYYNQPASVYFNNRMENNTVGYVHWGSNSPYTDRQDLSPGACATCTGTVSLPNPITTATEDAEQALWQQKLIQAGLTVGPLGTTATTTPPTTATGTVINPGFELDGVAVGAPTGWLTTPGTGSYDNADYTEAYGGAHTGTYHGTHYRPEAYEVYTYQVVKGLANGTYKFSAWVRSGGGQPASQLQAKNYGGAALVANVSATSSWVLVELSNIVVSNGQCEIGFYSKANAGGQWLYFDDVTLAVQPANMPPTVALMATTSITLGQALPLTATAADTDGSVSKVEFYAGATKLGETTTAPYQLSWTPTAVGSYSLTAVATDNAGASTTSAAVAVLVALPVVVPVPPVVTTGTVANPGFEADGVGTGTPTGWQKTLGAGTSAQAAYTESYTGGHSGTYHGTHYSLGAYEAYTYQVVSGLAAGTYSFSAWVKSSGGQATAQLRASHYGGATLSTNIAATPGGVTAAGWALVTVPGIVVTNGQCEIGFYSNAAAGGLAIYFDDVTFTGQPTPPVTAGSLRNTSFEDDQAPVQSPQQWATQTWGSTPPSASYTETYAEAHTGAYHGTHYYPERYKVYTYQTVSNLANGTYTLSAWVRSSGGQPKVQLQASNYGKGTSVADVPATPYQWVQLLIPGIVVSNGQCEVGFYSQAEARQWLHFDDVMLVKQETNKTDNGLAKAEVATETTLYPNPADDQVTITTSFARATQVAFVVSDLQGTIVAKYSKQAVAGANQFSLTTSTLPSGIYILQIQSDETFAVQHLEVRH